MKIRVIVNPKAGAGSAGRKVSQIRRTLAAAEMPHEIALTEAAGDATRLARDALRDGVHTIAVVGGDGTLNEVCQAYLDDDGNPLKGPALAVIPAGTGGDFRRTLELGKDAHLAVRTFLEREPRPIDLGVVEVTGDKGEPVRRAFVNIASFGVSGKIDRLVNETPKWMGGRAAFALGSLRAMSTYRNAPVSIRVDGSEWYEGRMVVTAIANGRYFGGGMQIAPNANPRDGLFDVVVLGDMNFAEALRIGPALYTGKHLGAAHVRETRGTTVEALPLGSSVVYVDTDGETPGRLPLKAWLIKDALSVRA
jgi:diacylglycerol kinase (ATP)